MVAKAAHTSFTNRRVVESTDLIGKTVHTTTEHYLQLLNAAALKDPQVSHRLEQLNTMY